MCTFILLIFAAAIVYYVVVGRNKKAIFKYRNFKRMRRY